MLDLIVRRETAGEHRTVEELTREAFWNLYAPGCDEHYLVHLLRDHSDYRADLSFVAEYDGKIIGLIMYSSSHVENTEGKRINTLTFGPLCVHPEYQRMGVGKDLIAHTRKLAVQMGENAVIILGHPHNYCSRGFVSSRDFNIGNAEGRYPFGQLVLELKEGIFDGGPWRFHYSDVFEVDPAGAAAFDAEFPKKEKLVLPSQSEFSIAVRAFLD